MANPAIKNGYFPIANELAERLALCNIPGNQMRILWVVLRKTWGWEQGSRRKDWDSISLSQFDRLTGMNHRNVHRSIKELVAKRLLLHSENGWKFNQNYDEWVVAKRQGVVVNMVVGSGQKATESSGQKATHKRKEINITKETIMQATPADSSSVNRILNVFYDSGINPTLNFANVSNRKAAQYLIDRFGIDRVLKTAAYACSIQGKQYAPTITTPYQLKDKLAQLMIYYRQHNRAADIGVV